MPSKKTPSMIPSLKAAIPAPAAQPKSARPPTVKRSAAAPVEAPTVLETKPTNPKDQIASSKLPLHLWPATATAMGCLGLLDGATKYGLNNYRALGAKASVYVGAAKRHLEAWMEGEDFATDSGVPHLANALACLAIIVDCQAAGNLIDDRSYPGGYHSLVDDLTKTANKLQADRAHLNPHHYTRQDV